MLENLKGQFAAILIRDEMKNVVGGLVDPGEGAKECTSGGESRCLV